jgi:hypothetical protein
MLIRTLPSASTQVVQGMRIGAILGAKVDLAKIFEPLQKALAEAEPKKAKKKAG